MFTFCEPNVNFELMLVQRMSAHSYFSLWPMRNLLILKQPKSFLFLYVFSKITDMEKIIDESKIFAGLTNQLF